MIVLVVAHATDAGAASVALRLTGELGIGSVVTLRPESLGVMRWSHRVDAHGRTATRIALPGHAPIGSHEIGAVLNRVRYLPLPRFANSSPKDRDYAGAEMQALVVSWLASLGDRVVNSVQRHPWVTPALSCTRLSCVAARCGLPFVARVIDSRAPWRSSDELASNDLETPMMTSDRDTEILVAGDAAFGALAARYGARCVNAARELGLQLASFRFAERDRARCLVDVDPLPSLDRPASVKAVCALLSATCAMECVE